MVLCTRFILQALSITYDTHVSNDCFAGEFEWEIHGEMTEVAMLNDSADESSSGVLALPSSTENVDVSDPISINTTSLPALPTTSGTYHVQFLPMSCKLY